MESYPVFLSVVIVVRNQRNELEAIVKNATTVLSRLVSDYEIVLVDNASEDQSIDTLTFLTSEGGFANIQVYALTKEVEHDSASWAGAESALGDFVAVIDPRRDDLGFLPSMLDHAVKGTDVVFARNTAKSSEGLLYRATKSVFNGLYKWCNRVDLAREAPSFRMLSKKVINFILQHGQPALTYRHLPATGGFTRENLEYSSTSCQNVNGSFRTGFDLGIKLLVSTTRLPMRLVTLLSLFGAFANLIYSVYVLAVAVFLDNVAPGWVSLSLQQSGMFFLISLVLLILGEYILQMASLSNEGPPYHVAQEMTSSKMTRLEKLNVEECD